MTTARGVSLAVAAVASCWPGAVDSEGPAELRAALHTLDADVGAADVVRAGYVAALLGGAFVVAAVAVVVGSVPLAALLAVGTAATVVEAAHRIPRGLARLRRTRALCASTDLFGRLILRARATGNVELAATFAARTGTDRLSRSLAAHVRRASGTPRSGLGTFAAEWSASFPALERAATLVARGVDAPPDEREALFDRALSTVVDSTQQRMETFAGDVRGPTTAVYAFGVLLPLALVGVLPAARTAGTAVPLAALAVVYDVVLPVCLCAVTGWLLVRRPVTFAPPQAAVAGSDSRPTVALAAAGVTAGVGAVGGAAVADWTAPLAATGLGVGAGLVSWYRPAKQRRERVREIESGLADALSVVGRRVADGEPVERALESGAADFGAVGELFGEAVERSRRLRVPLQRALFGEFGVLETVPSQRVRAAGALLSVAAVEGRPTGDALVGMGDQLRALDVAEREGARRLAATAGTLGNTAAVFGPLVGGATVALSSRMAAVEATAAGVGGGFSTPALGVVVGVYTLFMAVTLTTLSTGLQSGLDRVLVGYRVGGALVAATACFLGGFVAAGSLL